MGMMAVVPSSLAQGGIWELQLGILMDIPNPVAPIPSPTNPGQSHGISHPVGMLQEWLGGGTRKKTRILGEIPKKALGEKLGMFPEPGLGLEFCPDFWRICARSTAIPQGWTRIHHPLSRASSHLSLLPLPLFPGIVFS